MEISSKLLHRPGYQRHPRLRYRRLPPRGRRNHSHPACVQRYVQSDSSPPPFLSQNSSQTPPTPTTTNSSPKDPPRLCSHLPPPHPLQPNPTNPFSLSLSRLRLPPLLLHEPLDRRVRLLARFRRHGRHLGRRHPLLGPHVPVRAAHPARDVAVARHEAARALAC